jgi:6-phospho-3-hexuloisomerase
MDSVTTHRARPWIDTCAELCALGEQVDIDQFDQVVNQLGDATRRWFLTGQGRSGYVAAMAATRLMHIGHTCHLAGEATTPAVHTGDGLIVVSGSGSTPAGVRHARTARAEGADVIAVTRDAGSPLAQHATVTLQVPPSPTAQLGGNLFEQATLLILDTVINTLAGQIDDVAAGLRLRHANLQ